MEEKKQVFIIPDMKSIKINATKNLNAIETGKNLSKLNVNRGNLKGFVFEHRATEELNNMYLGNKKAMVIDNNGLFDIKVMKNGRTVNKIQAKCGYESSVTDLTRYKQKNSKVLINNDAINLEKTAKFQGVKYEKSSVTNNEVNRLSNTMKLESKITNSKTAPITSTVNQGIKIAKNCHNAGMNGAKFGALGGAGFSFGSNLVNVAKGNKDIKEATEDILVDTAVSAGVGYAMGAVGTGVATAMSGTAIGATIGTATTAIATSAVGSATIGAGVAVSSAISTGVATAMGSTLAATAVGGAMVVAAPVVVVAGVVGLVCSLIDW